MDEKEFRKKYVLLKQQQYLETDEFRRKDLNKQINNLVNTYKRGLYIEKGVQEIPDSMLDTMEIPVENENKQGGKVR